MLDKMLQAVALLAIVAMILPVDGTAWQECVKNGEVCANVLIKGNETLSDTICAALKKSCTTLNTEAAANEVYKLCAKSFKMCCNLPQYNCTDSDKPDDAPTAAACDFIKKNGFCEKDVSSAAKACPATCGLCDYSGPEGCQDVDHASCVKMKDFCTDPTFSVFLNQTCPFTCDHCPGIKCIDLNNDCSAKKGDCLKPENFEAMSRYCKKTCGMCSETFVCEDVASDCSKHIIDCTDETHTESMAKNCRSTCGLCNSNVCYDNIPVCNADFCKSEQYSEEQKKANCAKTCKYC